jgi:hypothetical protein
MSDKLLEGFVGHLDHMRAATVDEACDRAIGFE